MFTVLEKGGRIIPFSHFGKKESSCCESDARHTVFSQMQDDCNAR
jgi:hypothetical protein